jgi:hypothetical protein
MTDQSFQPVSPSPDLTSLQSEHKGILHQTLGEILHHNPHLQDKIIKSMHVTPEQFQQMLGTAGSNQYMNMTIGDLFKSGFIQQAMKLQGQQPGQVGQMSPEQLQQMVGGQQGQVVQMTPEQLQQVMRQQNVQGQPMQIVVQPQKETFFQKVKGLFR